MSKFRLLYTALIFTAFFALLSFLANIFYFYWLYWWFDVLMHFLGGVAGALSAYWVLFYSGLMFKEETRVGTKFFLVLSCVIVGGLGWELFEYLMGITDTHEGYHLDTVNDLILDITGGLLGIYWAMGKKRHG
jgi:hypothetical protein